MIEVRLKRNVRLLTDKKRLQRAAELTLNTVKTGAASDLSIIIGNDTFLKELNRKYRQVNAPTDVLSFPVNEKDPDTQSNYLGDIAISLQRASEQASSSGNSIEEELQLLVVHGTLHLLGYDHLEKVDKKKMQTVQDKILKQLGIKPVSLQ